MNASLLNTYVVITLACWSVWGILDKRALKNSSHVGVLARMYLMAVWQAPIVFLIVHASEPNFQIAPKMWMWTSFAAIFRIISFTAYLGGMSVTDASLVLGITASYPIVTQLLALLFLHESLVVDRLFGTIAICLGVLAIGSSHRASSAHLTRAQKWKLLACVLCATAGWGVWGIFDKLALEQGTARETWLAEFVWEVIVVVIALAFRAVKPFKVELSDKDAWLMVLISTVCLAIGKFSYLSALTMSSLSYIISITACYPLLMYLLAVVFLKEKFGKRRLLGILCVIGGGIAVQLTQNH